jgi:hypothetical protein
MSKRNPTPRENLARINDGMGYPAAGRGPSQPNRNTNTNTPVKHLPAVQFGDIHAVVDSTLGPSAKSPNAMSMQVGRRQPGQVSASSMPPVRGIVAAPVVGPDVKAPKPARK